MSSAGTPASAGELLADEVLGRLEGPWVAVMVYGSRVRGDFTAESDIDVLQLVEKPADDYQRGLLTVSVRTVWQLRHQCEDGDFYALSLCREGRVLADPTGVLARTLARFRPPPDNYARKWREYQLKLTLLEVPPEAFEANRVNLVRAALYLLRNACMIAYLRRFGEPCFSIPELARSLNVPNLPALFRGRADPANLTRERYDEVRMALGRLFAITAG